MKTSDDDVMSTIVPLSIIAIIRFIYTALSSRNNPEESGTESPQFSQDRDSALRCCND
jgi:hypothetical protein